MKKIIKRILIYLYKKCEDREKQQVCMDCQVKLKINVEQCEHCYCWESYIYNI